MQNKTGYNRIVTAGFFALLAGLAIAAVLLPDKELSESERRHYEQLPKLTGKAVADGSYMSDLEAYLLDHFAGREFFRTLKTEVETELFQKSDAGNYVERDGYLFELDYKWKKGNVTKTAKNLAQMQEEWFPEAEVYYAVIPDKTNFLPIEHYPAAEDDWVLAELNAQLSDAEYIDLYPFLTLEDYYKTDLHWRQEAVSDVAAALLEGMGGKPSETDYRKELVTSEFYGGYAGASAYRVAAEDMYALHSSMTESAVVYDYELQKESSIYLPEKVEGMDPYDYYLGGARALLTVKNPQVKDGKKLLLFRDSFGSSIAPLLLEGYEEITLVDLRYLSGAYLTKLIDVSSYDDVLYLYSQRVLRHSDSFKL